MKCAKERSRAAYTEPMQSVNDKRLVEMNQRFAIPVALLVT